MTKWLVKDATGREVTRGGDDLPEGNWEASTDLLDWLTDENFDSCVKRDDGMLEIRLSSIALVLKGGANG